MEQELELDKFLCLICYIVRNYRKQYQSINYVAYNKSVIYEMDI